LQFIATDVVDRRKHLRSMAGRDPVFSERALDLAQLRAWIEKMIASMRFVDLVVAIVALFSKMRDLNSELTRQLADGRRARPKAETLARVERQYRFAFMGPSPTQDKPAEESKKPDAPAPEPKLKKSRKGCHPGRAALPAHLERVHVQNLVPPEKRACPLCGSEMRRVALHPCEYLDVIPPRIVVGVRHDETVACPHDHTIISAETPPQLVERGKLSSRLLVEATANKYLDHLPIERQCLDFERAGVHVAPQTLGRGVAAAIDLLKPLARLIYKATRGPGLLATDNSGIPVLDRDAPDGIRTGTMSCWTNRSWVSFVYAPVGDAKAVREFLGEDLRRDVQCDGTSLTSFLERAGGRRPGCWAHARRRFVLAARGGDLLALEALRIIKRLFVVERKSLEARDSVQQRLARRQEHSKAVLETLSAWAAQHRGQIPPKSLLGSALGYLARQWHRLVLFVDDGRIELTNNRVERELRKLVLGRKNWLFTWGDLGGVRTATILTVVGTCIAHGVNPRAYLHWVIDQRVRGWPVAKLRELLPDCAAAAHPELRLRFVRERHDFLGRDPPILPAAP
jgi:transposase